MSRPVMRKPGLKPWAQLSGLALLLLACSPPPGGPGLKAPSRPTSVSVRLALRESAQIGTKSLNPPNYLHRGSDIRSTQLQLYRCTTQAAAQAANPAAEANCGLASSEIRHHPAGFTSLNFSLGNLSQNSFYTASVSAYSDEDLGGSLMGQAWPVMNAGLRELIRADADGSLSLVNDLAPLQQLDLTLQLGDTVEGGSVTRNSLAVQPGSVAVAGSESLNELFPASLDRLVNTYTTGIQGSITSKPVKKLAMDAAGNFAVVWDGAGAEDPDGVYAQRFDRFGQPLGAQFRVNTYTTGPQINAVVAMNAAGDFIVTWQSNAQPGGNLLDVYAQRYSAAGSALGGEFRVNTTITDQQREPSVAMSATGESLFAWEAFGQESGNGYGIFAQRYDAAGTALGAEFHVNTATVNTQQKPFVALRDDGDGLIVWQSNQVISQNNNVYGQLYSAAGTAYGGEFLIGSPSVDTQQFASATMNPNGSFVVTWEAPDGDQTGIWAQLFGAGGTALTAEFLVNATTANTQTQAATAISGNGDFMIAWQSNLQDGSGYGIFARRYSAEGLALSPEFQLNSSSTNDQKLVSLGMRSDGRFAAAWSGGGPGDASGIFTRLFSALGSPISP